MTWLSWRQHKTQLIVGGAVVGLLVVGLLVTGMDIHARFHSSGLDLCLARNPTTCGSLSAGFLGEYLPMAFPVLALIGVLPLLAAMFLGAPLVARETEQGLHRLAWTQSVSRTRWLLVKVAMLGIPMIAGIAVLAWLLSWWVAPLAAADAATAGTDGPIPSGTFAAFAFPMFDLSGLVPLAYVTFALAAGVAAGSVLRRTVAAMGVSLAGFVVLRWAIETLARPWYLPVHFLSYAFAPVAGTPSAPPAELNGSFLVYAHVLDKAGHLVFNDPTGITLPNPVLAQDCPDVSGLNGGGQPGQPPQPPDLQALQTCFQHAGIHVIAAYHPASDFWTFQAIEAGIFLALAVALVGLSVWWIRRRIV